MVTESEYFARQVGLRIPEGDALTPDGLVAHRKAYVAAMKRVSHVDCVRSNLANHDSVVVEEDDVWAVDGVRRPIDCHSVPLLAEESVGFRYVADLMCRLVSVV